MKRVKLMPDYDWKDTVYVLHCSSFIMDPFTGTGEFPPVLTRILKWFHYCSNQEYSVKNINTMTEYLIKYYEKHEDIQMMPTFNEFSATLFTELFSVENQRFQCNSLSIPILTFPQSQLQQKTWGLMCFRAEYKTIEIWSTVQKFWNATFSTKTSDVA